MGKLLIEGKAAKEFPYDLMNISVKFWATEGSAAAALKRVTQQSEEFLAILDSTGVKIEGIRIGKDSTRNSNNLSNGTPEVEAARQLEICVPFNMDFLNYIRAVVQKNAFDAEIETTYKFSDLEKIHEELIRMALNDAKEKAEHIVEAMGQRIVGVENVVVGNPKGKNLFLNQQKSSGSGEDGGGRYYDELFGILSRRVQAPVTTESESVEVEWLIE